MVSGKFIVRVSKAVHGALKNQSETLDFSLNQLCERRLAFATPAEVLPDDIFKWILNVQKTFGMQMLGAILFGSWARQETHQTSDIDIMIVLDSGTKITRSLYQNLDTIDSDIRLEPHFVKLPSQKERVTGLWAEVSIDGIIVSDCRNQIANYLGYVRRLISSQKIVSKRVHGQNYWVEVA